APLHVETPACAPGFLLSWPPFCASLPMTFNAFRWTFRSQCLAGFVACAALIGFAIYSQFAWGLEPCPMCIFQRLAFAALGLVFLVAGLHAPRTPGVRQAYGIIGFIAAAVGMALAGRHGW